MGVQGAIQSDFSAGVLSSELWGRIDSTTYKAGVEEMLNYIATLRGPPIRRPGSRLVSEVKDSSRAVVLLPFEFSTLQAYILEVGHLYGRVHRNGAVVTLTPKNVTAILTSNPAQVTITAHGFLAGARVVAQSIGGMFELNGREFRVAGVTPNTFTLQDAQTGAVIDASTFTPYTTGGTFAQVFEIALPWTEAQLPDIRICQSADVLFALHPAVYPQQATRTDHTVWTVGPMVFEDGPYQPENETAITLQIGAVGPIGTIVNLVSSANQFTVDDIGRPYRLRVGTNVAWCLATALTSASVLKVVIMESFTGVTAATTKWRKGVFSSTVGFPALLDLYQQRCVLARYSGEVTRVDFGVAGDIFRFSPSTTDGTNTITDIHAISGNVFNRDVNAIAAVVPDEKGLAVVTLNGEYLIHPNSNTTLLTPTDNALDRYGHWGGQAVQPVRAGKSVIFVQRSGEMLRETTFFIESDGFQSTDITFTCPEMVESGIKAMAYTRTPYPIIWCIRNDGALVGCTFERDPSGIRYAWHAHQLGGVSNEGGDPPFVESIASIPSPDGKSDEIYLAVRRFVNGRTVRTIERLAPFFRKGAEPHEAFYVDCGLSLNAPLTITGATNGSPVVVTFAAPHGLINEQTIYLCDINDPKIKKKNAPANIAKLLNRKIFKVKNVTATTAELFSTSDVAVNGAAHGKYSSGGVAALRVETITGLSHLAGQDVDILGDGAAQYKTVSPTGQLTLGVKAGFVHVGLKITARLKMLPLEAGATYGVAAGNKQSIPQLALKVFESQRIKYGNSFDQMFDAIKRDASAAPAGPLPLFTGVVPLSMETKFQIGAQICLEQNEPYPGMILAVLPLVETHEKGG